MEDELKHRALMSDAKVCDFGYRTAVKRAQLVCAAFALRDEDCPDMVEEDVRVLAWMAFLTTIPMYRAALKSFCTAMEHTANSDRCDFFARLIRFANAKDDTEDLASIADWEAWTA